MNRIKLTNYFLEVPLSLGKKKWESNRELRGKEWIYIFMTHRKMTDLFYG